MSYIFFLVGSLPFIAVLVFRNKLRHVSLFGLLSLAFCLGGLEAGLRVRPLDTYRLPYFIGRGFEAHPYLFWAPEGFDAMTVDPESLKKAQALGYHKFRSGEATPQKRPGAIRVITMGGSNAWGFGIQNYADTFTARLEAMCRQRYPQKDLEFIAAGQPGSILFQHLVLYKLYFRKYRPDLVVLYCNVNDGHLHGKAPYTFREMFRMRTGVDISRLWIDEFEFPKSRSPVVVLSESLQSLRTYHVLTGWVTGARDRWTSIKRLKELNSIGDCRSNLLDLIAIVWKDGAKIVLVDEYENFDPPPDAPIGRRRLLSQSMESVAAETNAAFIPAHEIFLKRFASEQILLPGDSVHINEKGHLELTKLIFEKIAGEDLLEP